MTGAFLIKLTQLEKTGSIGKIFIPLGNLKIPFSKLEIVNVFLHHLHVPIWRVLFMSFSADELQLNSQSALYLSASKL